MKTRANNSQPSSNHLIEEINKLQLELQSAQHAVSVQAHELSEKQIKIELLEHQLRALRLFSEEMKGDSIEEICRQFCNSLYDELGYKKCAVLTLVGEKVNIIAESGLSSKQVENIERDLACFDSFTDAYSSGKNIFSRTQRDKEALAFRSLIQTDEVAFVFEKGKFVLVVGYDSLEESSKANMQFLTSAVNFLNKYF